MKNVENDGSINVIVNDTVNDNFVDLNKTLNHTRVNEIENDDFVVAIHSNDNVYVNEEYLS